MIHDKLNRLCMAAQRLLTNVGPIALAAVAGLLLLAPAAHSERTHSIQVAAIFSLTGVAAANDASSVAGFQAAVADVNEHGGILGQRIEPLLLDSRSTPIGAMVAARKAAEAGVRAIIGPAWSSQALAVARLAQMQGIPMISNIATNPEVTRVGDYIFRVCFTDPFQGKVMADFAIHDRHAHTAVVMTDITSDFSMGLSTEFSHRFRADGGTILKALAYKGTDQNYTELAEKAAALNADACFLSGHDESGIIIRQLVAAGARCLILGGDGWSTVSFLQKGGASADKAFYCAHWARESDAPTSRALVQRYGDAQKLDSAWVLSYDAVQVFADALRRAGAADRKRLREALAATRNFSGASGTISFDANGDPVKEAVILKVHNGEVHFHKRVAPTMAR